MTGDARFAVAAPGTTDKLAGIFAKGVITGTYTQVGEDSTRWKV